MNVLLIIVVYISDNVHTDRFSRKIIWLRVGSTNHDPAVILLYYLEGIAHVKGIIIHNNFIMS